MRIYLINHTKSESHLFLYTRNLVHIPGFHYKITLNLCCRVVNLQMLFRSQKAGRNVCIKGFWFKKYDRHLIIANRGDVVKFSLGRIFRNILI